jgi:hypothetical protein
LIPPVIPYIHKIFLPLSLFIAGIVSSLYFCPQHLLEAATLTKTYGSCGLR